MHEPRPLQRRIALAAAVGILAATLWPLPGTPSGTPLWCVFCGSLGALDFINNVLLFAPLGAALAGLGWPWSRAVVAGAALSIGVEALQFSAIPGRDAGLGDLLANTTGALAGAALVRTREWRAPRPELAPTWCAAAALVFVGALAAGAVLLEPSPPSGELLGQWAPRRSFFDPFTGKIARVDLNGLAVPAWEIEDPDRYRRAFLSESRLVGADIETGPPPTFGITPIMRLVGDPDEMTALLQRQTDFVFRMRIRSTDAHLRTMMVALPGALPARGEPVRVEGGRSGPLVFARAIRPGRRDEATVALAGSLGWIFFAPFELLLGPWYQSVSDVWLALLAVPMGFYAAAARRPGHRLAAVVIPAAAIAVGVGVVPFVAGYYAAHWSEWPSAAIGVLAGAVVWRMTNQSARRTARRP